MGDTDIEDVMRWVEVLWDFHQLNDEIVQTDVIIGLGSYDLKVAERCAVLYHQHVSDRILFTGAVGNWTDGLFAHSEAETFAEEAIKHKVPQSAIMLEKRAANLGENVTMSAAFLPGVKSAVFVTKPQTQKRLKATVTKVWPDIDARITSPKTSLRAQLDSGFGQRALICEMVGDLARLRLYPSLGFQVTVEIPDPVAAAFQALIAAGYIDHLPT